MKHIQILSIALMATLLLSHCSKSKKETDPAPVVPETPKAKQTDQSGTAAANTALDDVNDIISNGIGDGINKRMEAYNLPCGVVSLDSGTVVNGKKVYTLKYGNQTKCGYRKRSGTVAFQLTNAGNFAQANAVFKITLTDYVVEIEATGDVVTLNGYITVKNTSGGYIWQAVTQNTNIEHNVKGVFSVLYANGVTRNKRIYQERSYSTTGGWAGLRCVIGGDTSIPAASNFVSEIGNTLEGNYAYFTEIPTKFFWQNCGTTFAGPYKLTSGTAILKATVPGVSPAQIEVQAGYIYNATNPALSIRAASAVCDASAYKITTTLGGTVIIQYQPY